MSTQDELRARMIAEFNDTHYNNPNPFLEKNPKAKSFYPAYKETAEHLDSLYHAIVFNTVAIHAEGNYRRIWSGNKNGEVFKPDIDITISVEQNEFCISICTSNHIAVTHGLIVSALHRFGDDIIKSQLVKPRISNHHAPEFRDTYDLHPSQLTIQNHSEGIDLKGSALDHITALATYAAVDTSIDARRRTYYIFRNSFLETLSALKMIERAEQKLILS